MEFKEFIDGYSVANNKENFLKKHIANTYVPYETKIDECKKIIYATTHTSIENTMEYAPSTALQNMFFVLTLVKYYLDVEYEISFDTYDELEKNGIVNLLLNPEKNIIPPAEVAAWQSVISMERNDAYDIETNMVLLIKKYIGGALEDAVASLGELVKNVEV